MAKHPKRKSRFRRYLRGAISHDLSLSTLAPNVAIRELFGDTVTERAFVTSALLRWTLSNFTPGVNIGPILVGIAHGDYTAAEIEAWIENQGSWEEADLIEQEVAKRKIRIVGVFTTPESSSLAVVLNDGKPIKTKCNWILTQGQTLSVWAYNTGAAALVTTSPVVEVSGHANLWPQ